MNWLTKISGYYSTTNDRWQGLWIDPENNAYRLDDTHHSWIYHNQELLEQEYDISVQQWETEREESRVQDYFEELLKDYKRKIAYEQDIEENQVVVPERILEEFSESASEPGIDRQWGIEIVDFLIRHGWIRASQKSNNIHLEISDNTPDYISKCQDALAQYFPVVWSNPHYRIIINNIEISSNDLIQHDNLSEAIESTGRANGYYMNFR